MKSAASMCYFSVSEYGWYRYGVFYPFEVWGNGPFFLKEPQP